MSRLSHYTRQTAKNEVITALGEQYPAMSWRERKDLVDYLQRATAILHTRYEASCSYDWTDTDRYRQETESREKRVLKRLKEAGLSDCAELQTDPRGWPLILRLNGREYRLGGTCE